MFPSQLAINYLAECKGGDEVSLTVLGDKLAPFLQGRVQGKLVFEAQISSV
jgi:hypothetical protein